MRSIARWFLRGDKSLVVVRLGGRIWSSSCSIRSQRNARVILAADQYAILFTVRVRPSVVLERLRGGIEWFSNPTSNLPDRISPLYILQILIKDPTDFIVQPAFQKSQTSSLSKTGIPKHQESGAREFLFTHFFLFVFSGQNVEHIVREYAFASASFRRLWSQRPFSLHAKGEMTLLGILCQ